jgi:hypothetical protein
MGIDIITHVATALRITQALRVLLVCVMFDVIVTSSRYVTAYLRVHHWVMC